LCKSSRDVYKAVSDEILSLHSVLKETDEILAEETDAKAAARLEPISMGCKEVLDELQCLVEKYHSLGTQAQRAAAGIG
jgi:hypothetical protein